jgi:hypothetical protein
MSTALPPRANLELAFRSVGQDRFELTLRLLERQERVTFALEPEVLDKARHDADEIASARGDRRRRFPIRELAEHIGDLLGGAVFTDEASALWDNAFEQRSESGRRLRLILSFARAPELSDLPWELMRIRKRHVALDASTQVVRRISLAIPRQPRWPEHEVLRIVAVTTSSRDRPPIDVDRARIESQQAPSIPLRSGALELHGLDPPTIGGLALALTERSPQVVHYVGHVGSQRDGSEALVLQDESGSQALAATSVLAPMFERAKAVGLLVLDTDARAGDRITTSFASTLVKMGVPAVLTTGGLSDSAAFIFHQALYEALAQGQVIDAAVAEARRQVSMKTDDDSWFVPSLYIGDLETLPLVTGASAARDHGRAEAVAESHSKSEEQEPRRRRLTKRGALEEIAGGVRFNAVADGGALAVSSTGPLPTFALPDGIIVTLLSPDLAALRRVADTWQKAFRDAGYLPPDFARVTARPDASFVESLQSETASESDALGQRAGRRAGFGADKASANGSSLAFLVEYAGASCLITGDAHADRLERSLARLGNERGRDRLHVDVTVLPNGGSARNVTPALLELLDCNRFVVSTDGSYFRHPDPMTIELLGRGRPDPVTVYFNYRSPTTERYADPEVQRQLNIVAVYPEGGFLSIAIGTATAAGEALEQLVRNQRDPADPLSTRWLSPGRPFLNRSALREGVRGLMSPAGPRILLVNGPSGSGKSYTAGFIQYIAEKTRAFRAANIVLDSTYGPADLAREFAFHLGLDAGSIPATDDQTHTRYVLQLAYWFLAQARASRSEWWLILDGFSSADLSPDTQQLVQTLVDSIERESTPLRLVLLGFDEPLPVEAGPNIYREHITPIREVDIREFVVDLLASASGDVTQEGIDEVMEQLLRDLPTGPQRLSRLNPRLESLVLALTRSPPP